MVIQYNTKQTSLWEMGRIDNNPIYGATKPLLRLSIHKDMSVRLVNHTSMLCQMCGPKTSPYSCENICKAFSASARTGPPYQATTPFLWASQCLLSVSVPPSLFILHWAEIEVWAPQSLEVRLGQVEVISNSLGCHHEPTNILGRKYQKVEIKPRSNEVRALNYLNIPSFYWQNLSFKIAFLIWTSFSWLARYPVVYSRSWVQWTTSSDSFSVSLLIWNEQWRSEEGWKRN